MVIFQTALYKANIYNDMMYYKNKDRLEVSENPRSLKDVHRRRHCVLSYKVAELRSRAEKKEAAHFTADRVLPWVTNRDLARLHGNCIQSLPRLLSSEALQSIYNVANFTCLLEQGHGPYGLTGWSVETGWWFGCPCQQNGGSVPWLKGVWTSHTHWKIVCSPWFTSRSSVSECFNQDVYSFTSSPGFCLMEHWPSCISWCEIQDLNFHCI